MRSWVKLLVIAMLVAFAVSTAVQSAQMTAMDISMSMTLDDGECSDCPSGVDVGCASGCIVPSLGLNDIAIVFNVPDLNQLLLPAGPDSLMTWQVPTDPYPPRTIVLS